MGMVQLDKLERLNEARIRNSEYLIERMGDISWLTPPNVPPYVKHTYFWLHILVDEDVLGFSTQELIRRLRERGVEVRHRYLEPLNRQPILNDNLPEALRLAAGGALPNYGEMHLPNAERAAGQVIGLPNRPDMTQAELDRVVDVLHAVGV